MRQEDRPRELDDLGRRIVDAAFRVHKEIGPGILEKVYEACLAEELQLRGLRIARQVDLPIIYRDRKLPNTYRLDLLVEDTVVLEVKAVEKILPVHDAQLLTYLRMSGKPLGFLINFNVPLIKDGIRRRVMSANLPR